MKFQLYVSFKETALAYISDNLKEYVLAEDALKFELIRKILERAGIDIADVSIKQDNFGNVYTGFDKFTKSLMLHRFYGDDGILEISLSDNTNISDKESILAGIPEALSFLKQDENILSLLETLAGEIAENSAYYTKNKEPIRAFCDMTTTCPDVDCFSREYLSKNAIINKKPRFAQTPEDQVMIPVPSAEDVIKALKDDIIDNPNDVLFDVPESSEFTDEGQREMFVDNNLSIPSDSIICKDISKFINLRYEIDLIFSKLKGVDEEQKQNLKDLAFDTINSIYRAGNFRAMGIPMEANGFAYSILFGNSEIGPDVFGNERELYSALVSLMFSLVFYEYEVYSEAQLLKKVGFIPKSELFERYAIKQIEVVLRYKYAFTGRISPSMSYSSEDSDDDDMSDGDSEMTDTLSVDFYQQLESIRRLPSGDVEKMSPDNATIDMKRRTGELDAFIGTPACGSYIRSIDNCEASILMLLQLMRFGEHKSQYLQIKPKEDTNLRYPYFDTAILDKSSVMNVERPFKTMYTDSGKEYRLEGVIALSRPIDGVSLRLPISVVLTKDEENGRIKRTRYAIMDIDMFLAATSRSNNGKMLISVEGFDIIDGIPEYNQEVVKRAEEKVFSPQELLDIRNEERENLIITMRTIRKHTTEIEGFCMSAGIDYRVGESDLDLLTASAMFDNGQLSFSLVSQIKLSDGEPRDYVLRNILKLYLPAYISSQSAIKNMNEIISLKTLLDIGIAKMRDRALATKKISESSKSLFDTMFTDRANYKLVYDLVVVNNTSDVVGYAYMLARGNDKYILLASQKEFAMKRPIIGSVKTMKFPDAKFSCLSHIANFYKEKSNLKDQMQDVFEHHKVVLYSENTVKDIFPNFI